MKKGKVIVVALAVLGMGLLVMMGCQTKEVTSAKVYIQQDDWDKAIEQLELAVKAYPNDPEAHYLLGEGYSMKRWFARMNEQFDASLKISPKFANQVESTREKFWVNHFNSGVGKINAGKVEDSITDFKTCLVIDPKKPEAYKNLAFSFIKAQKPDSAIAVYQTALTLSPKDTVIMTSLGTLYYEKKEYQKVIDIYQRLHEVEPNNVAAIANIALAYDQMGQSDKAFEMYQTALAVNPEDKDLIFNLGRLYYLKGDFEKAIEQFTKVLQADPNDYDSNLNTGNAYLSIADKKRKEAVDLEEKSGDKAKNQISQLVQEMLDNFAKAVPYLEKATELKPENALAWQNLGVAYVNTGMKEKGEAAFEKAEELSKK